MINAREDSLVKKSSFKSAFKKRRCLIPANGYYEWTGLEGDLQPYFITTKTGDLFCFAGLWETWVDKDNGTTTHSCAVITTDASPQIAYIHKRMPIILNPELYERWLDPDLVDFDVLTEMLRAGKNQDLSFFTVSKDVNSVGNNGPELMQAIDVN